MTPLLVFLIPVKSRGTPLKFKRFKCAASWYAGVEQRAPVQLAGQFFTLHCKPTHQASSFYFQNLVWSQTVHGATKCLTDHHFPHQTCFACFVFFIHNSMHTPNSFLDISWLYIMHYYLVASILNAVYTIIIRQTWHSFSGSKKHNNKSLISTTLQ